MSPIKAREASKKESSQGGEAATRALFAARRALKAGADVEARMEGMTPLMWAASDKKPTLLRILLEAGSDVEAKGRAGETALIRSVRGGSIDVMRALLDAGAKIDQADHAGVTPLHRAAASSEEKTEELLRRGAAVEPLDAAGHPPLRRAVEAGRLDNVQALARAGADLERSHPKDLGYLAAARLGGWKQGAEWFESRRHALSESAKIAGASAPRDEPHPAPRKSRSL